ncbi:MAG: ribosome-binding factor A, partial [Oscillospiraceae bacterium]|nr:ribosome-binding factor A [Oscillospiraceae bacterium]
SITRVDTTGDLRYARVYVSVLDKSQERDVLKGRGRDYVVPGDVSYIWTDAIAHRLVLPAGAAEVGRRTVDIAGEVLESVRPPRLR